MHRGSFPGAGQSGGDPRADRLQREGHGLPPQRLPGSTPPHPARCEPTAPTTPTRWRDVTRRTSLHGSCSSACLQRQQRCLCLLTTWSLSLQLYDKINSRSSPQIRNPPSDGVQRAKEVRKGPLISHMALFYPSPLLTISFSREKLGHMLLLSNIFFKVI